jgi:hypothetical protein
MWRPVLCGRILARTGISGGAIRIARRCGVSACDQFMASLRGLEHSCLGCAIQPARVRHRGRVAERACSPHLAGGGGATESGSVRSPGRPLGVHGGGGSHWRQLQMGERRARDDPAHPDRAALGNHGAAFLGADEAGQAGIVDTATFAATAATLWWFGDRGPRREAR